MFDSAIWQYVRRYDAQKPARSACRAWERERGTVHRFPPGYGRPERILPPPEPRVRF